MTILSNPFIILSAKHCHIRGFLALSGLMLMCSLFVPVQYGATRPGAGTGGWPSPVSATTTLPEETHMWMTVGKRRFSVTLANTEAARAFVEMLPISIDMTDFNSNEKHAYLPKTLPTDAHRPGTIRNGDLMLYGSKTLVLFYLTFDSSYSYTRIGHVDEPAGLAQLLGPHGVRIGFSMN